MKNLQESRTLGVFHLPPKMAKYSLQWSRVVFPKAEGIKVGGFFCLYVDIFPHDITPTPTHCPQTVEESFYFYCFYMDFFFTMYILKE